MVLIFLIHSGCNDDISVRFIEIHMITKQRKINRYARQSRQSQQRKLFI
jgi:hypothetical protein